MLRAIIFLALLLAFTAASAHNGHVTQVVDPNDQEFNSWVQGLKDRKGVGCCSTADGYPADVEWDTANDRYRVRIEGVWYTVPATALIDDQTNRFGTAMVWYYVQNGEVTIRCFMPGALL